MLWNTIQFISVGEILALQRNALLAHIGLVRQTVATAAAAFAAAAACLGCRQLGVSTRICNLEWGANLLLIAVSKKTPPTSLSPAELPGASQKARGSPTRTLVITLVIAGETHRDTLKLRLARAITPHQETG